MVFKSKFLVFAIPAAVLALVLGGCTPQSSHPNQISAFDGSAYDSFTAAHGALSFLRAQVSTTYRKYVPEFNQAAAAYSAGYNAYALYRANAGTPAEVSTAIANLTTSIVSLESTFETDMHVAPNRMVKIRKRAARMRAATSSKASVSEILTELEIAAAIAQTVPAAQPYAALAAVVIGATQQAIAAESAASGRDIDLSTIQPVPAIQ